MSIISFIWFIDFRAQKTLDLITGIVKLNYFALRQKKILLQAELNSCSAGWGSGAFEAQLSSWAAGHGETATSNPGEFSFPRKYCNFIQLPTS